MHLRRSRLSPATPALLGLAAVPLLASAALALGLQLSQTKEELKLAYEVAAVDHGTGRVSVTFTLGSAGRLQPLTSIELVVPSREGTGFVDLSLPLRTREEGGKQVARVHLKRDWAERAEIQLRTAGLDGRTEPLTWYYHSIPVGRYLPAARKTD